MYSINNSIVKYHDPAAHMLEMIVIKIYKYFVPTQSALLLAADCIVLYFLITITMKYSSLGSGVGLGNENGLTTEFFNSFTLSIVLVGTTALSGLAVGLYRRDTGKAGRWGASAAAAVGLALTLGSVVLLTVRFFRASPPISLAHWEIGLPAIWPVCFVVTRWISVAAARRGFFKRRILLLGDGRSAAEIESFCSASAGQLEIAGRLGIDAFDEMDSAATAKFSAEGLRKTRIREVVTADEGSALPTTLLLQWKVNGIAVTDCLTFWEREAGRIALDAFDVNWFLRGEGCRRRRVSSLVKRATDICAALLLLILTAPILAIFAALIPLETAGPIFYSQQRTGRYGKPFMLLKFRSMRTDAEAAIPQWAANKDPRVTRVGKFMRSTRIDELPQLLTVIRGDMSLIGPRPERPFFVDQLTRAIPHYSDRHYVRPGLTGWAQINYPYGASIEDAREKLAYDLFYLKNQSTILDLYIMIATIRVILLGEGAR
ncbi:MAG: exopolysaccharide biosynthesis polyprenyl glycosylphosphotransferase [Stellaceae bacterium]